MKTLIYLDINKVISHGGRGGPLGVGYYINEEVKSRNIEEIYFLGEDNEVSVKKNYKDFIPNKLRSFLRIINRYKTYKKLFDNPSEITGVDFNNYEVIHFHSTEDLFITRKSLENYNGKILLTSHSPVPQAQERMTETLTQFERKYFKHLYKRLPEMDEYAFKRADYIIFPCPEAEEPYINNWTKYTEIKAEKSTSYRYVATGISPKIALKNRSEIRKEFNIKDSDFVISYVGRHNSVKGYDQLKEIGQNILNEDDSIKIIVAGKETPMTRLEHPNWIEIGFTKDPYSYIAASDVFILPNKETYFDLVMLEVLSLCKIVIASRTGGNKYYERHNVPGVLLYDTPEEANRLLKRIHNMGPEERDALGKSNFDFYSKNLTGQVFFDSYINILKEIEGAL